MTPERFTECLTILGYNARGLANLVKRDHRAMRRWLSGDGRVPVPDDLGAWLEEAMRQAGEDSGFDLYRYARRRPLPKREAKTDGT